MPISSPSEVAVMKVVENIYSEMSASQCEQLISQTSENEELDFTRKPPTPTQKMFPHIIGKTVQAVTEKTEAVAVSVAANILSTFGTMVGRPSKQTPNAPVFHIGDSDLHSNSSFLITGDTSKGRKGTSDKPVIKIFKHVDELLFERHSKKYPAENKSELEAYWPLNTHTGGLSTGEGLAYLLRDPVKDDEGVSVNGQYDKRLLIRDEEFQRILAVGSRENNTLTSILRIALDGETISPLTKSARVVATNPHISIIAHITAYELVHKIKKCDVANGFLNRIPIIHSQRNKTVALPKRTPDSVINDLAIELADTVNYAQQAGQIRFDNDSPEYWEDVYKKVTVLNDGHEIDFLLARSEPFIIKIAMITALLDRRNTIGIEDLKTGVAWFHYWRDSITFIFDGERQKVEASELQYLADDVLTAVNSINDGNGCSRTQISEFLNGNKSSAQISRALELQMNTIPPKIRMGDVKGVPLGKKKKVKLYYPC